MATPIITAGKVSLTEGLATDFPYMSFQVTLSEVATSRVTVSYFIRERTAMFGDTYSGGSGTVTFEPGQTSGTASIRLQGDTLLEPDEFLVLELYNPVGAVFAGGLQRLQATGFILDDEGSGEKRALMVSDVELLEGDAGAKFAVFKVLLSRASNSNLVFDYRTEDGSAVAGTDYTATTGVLTILAGQTEATVQVAVSGDADVETAETFSLVLTPQAGSSSAIANGADGRAGIATLVDDDTSATRPEIFASGARLLEGVATDFPYMYFQVNLSEAATSRVTVSYFIRERTATFADTYSGGIGTVTFETGQTTGYATIRLQGDTLVEPDEFLVLDLYNPVGADFAGGLQRLQATGFILDDDGTAEKRALMVSDVELLEGDAGAKFAVFKVLISRASTSTLVFDYRTVDGSAVAGQDYTATTGVLTMLAGQTEASVLVPVTGDSTAETAETFSLVLTPQAGSGTAIANGADGRGGIATITDDDTSATLPEIFASGARLLEGVATDFPYLYFQVNLSEAPTSRVTVSYFIRERTATFADTYSGGSGTVTFETGETTGYATIRLQGDTLVEPDEFLVLELYNPVGAVFAGGLQRLQATGFILDDDGTAEKRALMVSDVELLEGDAGSKFAVFKVLLSRPSTSNLVFDYRTVDGSAVAGQDYSATTGVLTIPAGQTEASVQVAVSGDSAAETAETFSLVLTPQVGSSTAIANGADGRGGIATITDDDTSTTLPEIFASGARLLEGIATDFPYLYFQVNLSEAPTSRVTVSYFVRDRTATFADTYSGGSGTVTFEPGQTSGLASIRLQGDILVEPDEFLVLELYNPVGAVFAGGQQRLQATAFILDDDGTAEKRALMVADVELLEGNAGSKFAVFKVLLSRPSTNTLVFDYRTVDGSAVAGQDYTASAGVLTIPAGQTEASVQVAVAGDTSVETAETFSLVLTPQASSAAAIANGADGRGGIATLVDDDTSATLPEIFASGARLLEGIASDFPYMYFPVHLSEAPTSRVTVAYTVRSGTATYLDTYSGGTGTVTFETGETTGYASIRLQGDTLVEPDEFLVLELYNPFGAAFAGGLQRLQAAGFIVDDDGTSEKRALVVNGAELLEGDSGSKLAVFKVQLSRAALADLVFDYRTLDGSAVAGTDYTAATGTLTMTAGQTEAHVFVPVLGDTSSESEESFSLLLTPQAGSAASIGNGVAGRAGVALITDNDNLLARPLVAVRNATVPEGTASSANYLEYELVLSQPVTSAATVAWRSFAGGSASASDLFSGVQSGTVTFATGTSTNWVSIRVASDATPEADEFVVFELTNPSGMAFPDGLVRLQALGVVQDDDGVGNKLALIVGDTDVVEGDSGSKTLAVQVRLSRPSSTEIALDYQTADGSALARVGLTGGDYTATSGRLVFAPGQTLASVQIPILGDVLIEPSESFSLIFAANAQLANGAAAVAGTIHIIDTDTPPVQINVGSDATIDEGSTFSRVVTITDGADSGANGWTWSVRWSDGVVSNGTASAAQSSFTITRAFPDDVAAPLEAVVTVTDEGTESDVERFTLSVPNRAPSLSISGGSVASEGTSYRLSLAASDPAGAADPLTYTIDWGDGGGLQSLTAAQLAAAGGGVNRLFADAPGAHGTVVTRTMLVTVNDGDGGITQRSLDVQVSNVVQVRNGTAAGDVMPEGAWGDIYNALAGNDTITPGDGFDTIDGGAGFDRVSYAERALPVQVDLALGSAVMVGGNDGLTSIEAVSGSAAADTLLGDAQINAFTGGLGNDTIDGRGGFDVANYAGTLAVSVDLRTGSAVQGVHTDTLIAIEGIVGSSAADTLRGMDLAGNAGETFRGGGGNDSLFGGSGIDTAEFAANLADYTIARSPGSLNIVVTHRNGGVDGNDALDGIEHLFFADRLVSFGPRAEDVARVAFALWTPAIYSSATLFSKGVSFYDNQFNYSFDFLCEVALQYHPENGQALADKLKASIPGISYSAAQLLAIMNDNGGGSSAAGKAAAVKAVALDAATTQQLEVMGVTTKGVVATFNFDAEVYFTPMPG